jgi:hypothetical protein
VHTFDIDDGAASVACAGGQMGVAMPSIELGSAVKDRYDEAQIEANARRCPLSGLSYRKRHGRSPGYPHDRGRCPADG